MDLARPERGALRVEAGDAPRIDQVLPRSSVTDATWAKILQAVHAGWAESKRP